LRNDVDAVQLGDRVPERLVSAVAEIRLLLRRSRRSGPKWLAGSPSEVPRRASARPFHRTPAATGALPSIRGRFRERALDRAEQEIVHGPRIAKTQLELLRVRVHVHLRRVEAEVEVPRR
jgi:hypothetical protein